MCALGRIVGGSWLAPGAFLPLCWTVYFGSAVMLADLFPLCAPGSWLLLSCVSAFQAGALLCDCSATRGRQLARPETIRGVPGWLVRRLAWGTVVLTAVSAAGVMALVWTGLSQFGLSWSTVILFRLATSFSAARYAGTDQTPLVVSLLLYVALAASVVGGLLVGVSDRPRDRWLAVAPLLVSLCSGIVVAARLGVVTAIVMWSSAAIAARLCVVGKPFAVFRPRWIVRAVVAAATVLSIYAFLQWMRGGGSANAGVRGLFGQAFSSSIGSVAAFTSWACEAERGRLGWGMFTLAGPYDLFGLTEREQGLFGIAVYFPSGYSTNIYTIFRSLIEDVGMVGAWTALGLIGAAAAWSYRGCLARKSQWCIVLSIFYSVTVISLLTTLFAYNSPIVGWMIGALVWMWPSYRAAGPVVHETLEQAAR
jgi:oligosaccharide repeat unit polymerase